MQEVREDALSYIGKTAKIIGYSTDGWVHPDGSVEPGCVAHICLEIEGKRVFFEATDETHEWRVTEE